MMMKLINLKEDNDENIFKRMLRFGKNFSFLKLPEILFTNRFKFFIFIRNIYTTSPHQITNISTSKDINTWIN